ncbi:hypothetical protein DQ04_03651010 [Trypanosoma grayi]|uniref:hypothetical protein n=1 Tax=Trypanosoma grayi TaxID=71804 RepID=UPI0004F464F0|nr:hypothetical protein DQ04_03651010 [Trypanosoma grayi]KEG10488.1 hypothetical protein DQ04_03651010 [Trypanosoma grayi]
MPPHFVQKTGLPPIRTLFITNVPPTIDNSQNLLPYVPREGLLALRVKRSGGRDVGFADYDTVESAHRALQWFSTLDVTTEIAASCLRSMPPTWTPIPPKFRLPVPYEEYNRCAGDPARSTELLLNSVILVAEWSISTPTCRPNFVPSAAPLQPSLNQERYGGATVPRLSSHMSCQPPLGFFPPSSCHAGLPVETRLHHMATVPQVRARSPLSRSAGGSNTHGSDCPWNSRETENPLGNSGPPQHPIPQQNCHWRPKQQQSHNRCCTEGAHTYVTPSMSHIGRSRVSLSDPGGSFAALDDTDLPSSTLFVKVLRYRGFPHQPLSSITDLTYSSAETEVERSGRAWDTSEVSPALNTQEQQQPHPQPQLHPPRRLENLFRMWSHLHHRHHCLSSQEDTLGEEEEEEEEEEPPFTCGAASTAAPERVVLTSSSRRENMARGGVAAETSIKEEHILPSSSSSPTRDNGDACAVVEMVLNRDFFSERFAGFRSYVSYGRQSGFVLFERPGDARQCLRWLRRQPDLQPFLMVQFAREDTRRRRFQRRRSK